MLSEESARALLPCLADEDPAVRERACADLLAADPEGAVLVPLLLRDIAAGGGASEEAGRQMARLAEHASRHCPGDPRIFATLRSQAVSTLLSAARDGTWLTRSHALDVLGLLGRGDPVILRALVGGLRDMHECVRTAACYGLAAWGDKAAPAVPALIPLLGLELVGLAACIALEAIGPAAAEAIPALQRRARTVDPDEREVVENALKAIAGPTPPMPPRSNAAQKEKAGDRSEALSIGEKRVLELPGERLSRIALAPCGKIFATADGPHARLRRVADGSTIAHFQHDGEVCSMTFSPDGRVLVTTSADRRVRIFRVDRDSVRLWKIPTDMGPYGMTGDGDVDGTPVRPAIAPDGKRVAFPSPDGICLIEPEIGRRSWIGISPAMHTLMFLADGRTLLWWSSQGGFSFAWGTVTAAYPAPGELLRPLAIRAGAGQLRLVSSSREKESFIDEPIMGSRLHTIVAETPGPHAFAHDAGGRLLAVGSGTKVQLIRLDDGQELGCVTDPSASIQDVACLADGTLLAAADESSRVLFWTLSGAGGAAQPRADVA